MATQAKSKCEKFRMLRRIVYKVTEEKIKFNTSKESMSTIERAGKYTGLHYRVLGDLHSSSSFEVEHREVDRIIIYFELVNFYLAYKSIPTTKKLFNALYKKIPQYWDIGYFKKMLVKMDFIWKKSQYGCVFVIERPEVIIERYQYLKSMIQYRQDDNEIYFVDENSIEAVSGYLSTVQSNRLLKTVPSIKQQRVIYAVSKSGIHCVKFISSFDENTFENWIMEDLLPFLSTPSVVVYNNSTHHCRKVAEIPTRDSLKIELTEWLERNGIPFDSAMSKYELYSLIETCTDLNENVFKIDRILEANGHRVLRIPNCIKSMTPGNLLNRIITKNVKQAIFKDTNTWQENVLDNFNELMKCIPVQVFVEFNNIISKYEQRIFDTDKAVDAGFDRLLEKISFIQLDDGNDSEIPSCSESE